MNASAGGAKQPPDATFRVLVEDSSKKPEKPVSWWETPLAKAIGGFLLLTVAGGVLTTTYQTQQWSWQQDYGARAERAKKRAEVAREVLQRVAESFSWNNHLVYLIAFEEVAGARKVRDAQLTEALSQWYARRREWPVHEKVLVAEIEANFSYPAVHCLLGQILRNRDDLATDVTQFVVESRGQPIDDLRKYPGLPESSRRIFLNLFATTGNGGLLSRLSDHMIQETRDDRPSGTTLFGWLFGPPAPPRNDQVVAAGQAIDTYLGALRGGDVSGVPLDERIRWTKSTAPELVGPVPQRRPQPISGEQVTRNYLKTIAALIKEVREEKRLMHGSYARVIFDIVLRTGEVIPSCECFRFANGEIVEVTQYFDPRSTMARP